MRARAQQQLRRVGRVAFDALARGRVVAAALRCVPPAGDLDGVRLGGARELRLTAGDELGRCAVLCDQALVDAVIGPAA